MAHDNLAVMENRLTTVEEAVKDLVELSRQQATVNSNLETAIELLQASHADSLKSADRHGKDIDGIKEKQNMMRGGWLALCAIGAVIVGLAAVVGALVAVLALKHN